MQYDVSEGRSLLASSYACARLTRSKSDARPGPTVEQVQSLTRIRACGILGVRRRKLPYALYINLHTNILVLTSKRANVRLRWTDLNPAFFRLQPVWSIPLAAGAPTLAPHAGTCRNGGACLLNENNTVFTTLSDGEGFPSLA